MSAKFITNADELQVLLLNIDYITPHSLGHFLLHLKDGSRLYISASNEMGEIFYEHVTND